MIERHQLLATVSAELASSLDYETSVREVCAFPVRSLADWCVLHLRGQVDDALPHRREIATSVAGAGELAEQLRGQPIDSRQSLVREALFSGRSLLIERIEGDPSALLLDSPERTGLLPAVGAVSLMVVALKARGRIGGALLLLSSRPERHYGAADLLLAEELAQIAALALDNARLYQQACNATSARNEVLNVVAHDLRSPINGILLTLDFLAEKLAERGASDLVDPWVTGLVASTRAMNRIVGELLELTRLESGQIRLDRRPLDPAQVVERALHEARARHAEVVMAARLGQRLPALEADESRVAQVLACLIDNLVKFRSEDTGEIVVAIERVGNLLRFSVTDAGSPTDASELEHLFDRFWEAGHLDRRGAALGLSIAKALVVLHGGRIWAESSAEMGTTLLFTLSA